MFLTILDIGNLMAVSIRQSQCLWVLGFVPPSVDSVHSLFSGSEGEDEEEDEGMSESSSS